MWIKWLPWRWIIRGLARSHGFLDPISVLDRVRQFAEPSEVREPIELLRAGAIFHARGMINSRVIQHNLDWVWPFWIERQFDPMDDAFIPRAFSITHINLSHRNWTAVGLPGMEEYPIVDPRGLITPFLDGWSLDAWIIKEDGSVLLPSRCENCRQSIHYNDSLSVSTDIQKNRLHLFTTAQVVEKDGSPLCLFEVTAKGKGNAFAVITVRPCNPEGVSFVHRISLSPDGRCWTINNEHDLLFQRPPDRHMVSRYRDGDVFLKLPGGDNETEIECSVGMATGAALFQIGNSGKETIKVKIPLKAEKGWSTPGWKKAVEKAGKARLPDELFSSLYNTALRSVILHSPHETYPGPYTYKKFWFRDAAFIVHALLCAGLTERAEKVIWTFFDKQLPTGYFRSQEGEWDSNGQVLWIINRFCELTNTAPPEEWKKAVYRGATWIRRKRLKKNPGEIHSGLLPAGFSAEHLGPNDYYYWDDYWAVGGLRAAAKLAEKYGDKEKALDFKREADDLLRCIDVSLKRAEKTLDQKALPASPSRRMDSGAVGSLVAGYPLQLLKPDDERLIGTAEFLLDNSCIQGGFFQDMIHSGMNPYLTLHLAQVLLRGGDNRYFNLMKKVADLASPTGQWPEAVNPKTLGGCMGDGQHVWAAAEWILMVRNLFIREEGKKLVLAGGIPKEWLEKKERFSFGPVPSTFGRVSVEILPEENTADIRWEASWWRKPDSIEIRLPGFSAVTVSPEKTSIHMEKEQKK